MNLNYVGSDIMKVEKQPKSLSLWVLKCMMVKIDRVTWAYARKWNDAHTISEGRYVTMLSPNKQAIQINYVPPGGHVMPGWLEMYFPKRGAKTVSTHRSCGPRKIILLNWC